MLGIVSEDENHNKIFKPMAGATLGQGVPLGTWCSFEKDVAPSDNWLMAGTTFDASVYPALNLYLGNNVVPSRYDHNRPSEWEDFYVFNNNSYIMSSAPYDGKINVQSYGTGASRDIAIAINDEQIAYQYTSSGDLHIGEISFKYSDKVVVSTSFSGSIKKAWVSFYKHPLFIKATSIASDTDQQAILAQIQAYNTYSTEETLTGKTWLDGKPIYKKTYPFTTPLTSIDGTSLNIDTLIEIKGGGYSTGSSQTETAWYPLGYSSNGGDVYVSMTYDKSTKLFTYIGWRNLINGYYTIEYTKTND